MSVPESKCSKANTRLSTVSGGRQPGTETPHYNRVYRPAKHVFVRPPFPSCHRSLALSKLSEAKESNGCPLWLKVFGLCRASFFRSITNTWPEGPRFPVRIRVPDESVKSAWSAVRFSDYGDHVAITAIPGDCVIRVDPRKVFAFPISAICYSSVTLSTTPYPPGSSPENKDLAETSPGMILAICYCSQKPTEPECYHSVTVPFVPFVVNGWVLASCQLLFVKEHNPRPGPAMIWLVANC